MLKRKKNYQPEYETFNQVKQREWKRDVKILEDTPASIVVTKDADGKIMPVAAGPLVEPGTRQWVVPLPAEIPKEWAQAKDTSKEYQQAMEQYQKAEVAKRMRQFPQGRITDGKDPSKDVEGNPIQSQDKSGDLQRNYVALTPDSAGARAQITAAAFEALPTADKAKYEQSRAQSLTERRVDGKAGEQGKEATAIGRGGRGRGRGRGRGASGRGKKASTKKTTGARFEPKKFVPGW